MAAEHYYENFQKLLQEDRDAKAFLEKWLQNNKDDLEKLQQFYQYFTGAYNSNVNIKILQSDKPICHACFQQLCIPQAPEEMLKKIMEDGYSQSQQQGGVDQWTEENFGWFLDGWIQQGLGMGIA